MCSSDRMRTTQRSREQRCWWFIAAIRRKTRANGTKLQNWRGVSNNMICDFDPQYKQYLRPIFHEKILRFLCLSALILHQVTVVECSTNVPWLFKPKGRNWCVWMLWRRTLFHSKEWVKAVEASCGVRLPDLPGKNTDFHVFECNSVWKL